MTHSKRFSTFLLALGLLLSSGAVSGAVKFEGSWPEADKSISLDAAGLPRSEAVRRIADAAGWNVVWSAPSTAPVDIHVKKQPATKVLELVLSDTDYVARRQGELIQIERDHAPAATAVPPPLPSPVPPPLPSPGASASADDDSDPDPNPLPSKQRGRHKSHRADRTVFGGNLRVEKDETVKDITVLGGTVDILGTVRGDVSIMGGSAHIYPGARVSGDLETLGGSLKLDDGAIIEGDVNLLGGEIDRAPGAEIHGDVSHNGMRGPASEHHRSSSKLVDAARSFGGHVTRTAMLFVFGAVLLALATRRMGFLQGEAAERPMRSFALGVVGSIAMVVLAVLLCVTLIGIPVAVVGLLVAIVAAYAGVCAVLCAAGGALLSRWTHNPYLHLAAGCALLLLVGFIPYAGTWLTVMVVLTGIGTVVATRAAGFIPPRGHYSAGAAPAQPTAGAA